MCTRRYVRALWLAALLGLLVAIPASCVAPTTETPAVTATVAPPTVTVAQPAATASLPTVTATTAPSPTTPAPTVISTPTAPPTAVSPAAGTASAVPATTTTAAAATTAPSATTQATTAPSATTQATTAPSATTQAATAPSATTQAATATGLPLAATATTTTAPAITATATLTPTCCISERCVVDGAALTVRSVTMTGSAQGVGTPEPGNRLLLADVTIENVGGELLPFRPDLFRVRAQDGAEFTARTITPNESGNPAPGETVLLRVVFEVPESASGFTLIYAPPTLGDRQIRVDLGCSRGTPTPTPS